jgi:hypothetical protein
MGVGEATICREFGGLFDVLRLRVFRFDAPLGIRRYLGWSCLLRRQPVPRSFRIWFDYQPGAGAEAQSLPRVT